MPAIAAHRGWHADGAAKNSVPALERAARGATEWTENDVHELRDGVQVVHHDPALADGRLLADLDSSILASHPEIPTLEEWSRRAGELDMGALVELKEHGGEERTVETVSRHVPRDKINYMSFNAHAVRRLRELEPDLPIGLLSDLRPPDVNGLRRSDTARQIVDNALSAGASFVGLNVGQATEPVLAAAHGAGLGVAVWTVDEAPDLKRLMADHRVTTVITDKPALAQEIRSSLHDVTSGVRLLRAAATMR